MVGRVIRVIGRVRSSGIERVLVCGGDRRIVHRGSELLGTVGAPRSWVCGVGCILTRCRGRRRRVDRAGLPGWRAARGPWSERIRLVLCGGWDIGAGRIEGWRRRLVRPLESGGWRAGSMVVYRSIALMRARTDLSTRVNTYPAGRACRISAHRVAPRRVVPATGNPAGTARAACTGDRMAEEGEPSRTPTEPRSPDEL